MANSLHLTAVIWKEGARFVSRCPEVGVASFGATPSEAHKALQEAVEWWIANAREPGLLGDITPSLENEER
jgi:predicted RNase H-like HicB family nuclease